MLDCSGIRLHRDLRVRQDRQARGESVEQRRDRAGAEERRRAAAEEDARHGTPLGEVEIAIEVGEERCDIFRLGKAFRAHVRIEIAVGTFAHAPGQVHIDRERLAHACILWTRAVKP